MKTQLLDLLTEENEAQRRKIGSLRCMLYQERKKKEALKSKVEKLEAELEKYYKNKINFFNL